jgi:hypothetical protein
VNDGKEKGNAQNVPGENCGERAEVASAGVAMVQPGNKQREIRTIWHSFARQMML